MVVAFVAAIVALLVGRTLWVASGHVAAIWLTSEVLLAQSMVVRPQERWWVLTGGALGNFSARFLVGNSLAVSFTLMSANIVEVAIVLLLLPGISTVAELIRPESLVKFLVGGAVLAPAMSGMLATALLGWPLSGPRLPTFSHWFAVDALSFIIFTPVAVVFWTGEVVHLFHNTGRWKTGFLLLTVSVVATAVFAQNHFLFLYWLFLPIVLLAFQADVAGVLIGLLLCFAIAMAFTIHGSGPLWINPYESMQRRIFELQLFLVAVLAIALPISAAQAQRMRLFVLLREGERRYRILAENASDIVMSMSLDGRLTYVSPRAKAVIGSDPDHLIGSYYPDLALPDDHDSLAVAIARLALDANEASRVSRVRCPDGRVLWLETFLRPVIDPISGKPEALTATARDVTERTLMEKRAAAERLELEDLAFRDGLTGLFNRRHFDRELGRHWKQEARADKRAFVAVIMADVDAYKSYNDRYGHQCGDECLRVIAQAIASSVTRSGDLVARYGGEEFGLILRDTDQQGALVVAERIRERVENLRIPHAACNNGVVTISLGVAAQQTRESQAPTILVAAADRALYAAKRQGRNRTCAADLDREEATAI
ncbi:diguanylate cyclase [Paraburkholderia fungorum]|uniref:bifunctional diguanylate cyclase/phosphodiesterase n=1 Tax=Paraburkholderia TaxID=1822464 RepID=UPI0038BB990B